MKVIKFKTNRGRDMYGLKKWVWTIGADVFVGYIYYDFYGDKWVKQQRLDERQYMRESAKEVIEKFDSIKKEIKLAKEKNRTKRGIVISDLALRKQLEDLEEDEIQDARLNRWGVDQ